MSIAQAEIIAAAKAWLAARDAHERPTVPEKYIPRAVFVEAELRLERAVRALK